MGLYNVVEPCVVGKLHYARPTAQPIEVDDTEAAELVESGCLAPYQPGGAVFKVLPDSVPLSDPLDTEVGQAVAEQSSDVTPESPRPRARRRTED